MRSNLGGNRAFLPSRANPLAPPQGPRQNSTAKSTATLISETFSSSSAALRNPSYLLEISGTSWYCHRCASANCECVPPELVSSTFLPRDWLPAAHDQHKIICSLSAVPPSVCEYRHIHEFWLQQKFQKTTFGLLSPHHISHFLIF
jgi:hypothetical protein